MKRRFVIGALIIFNVSMIVSAQEVVPEKSAAEVSLPEIRIEAAREQASPQSCDLQLVKQVEGLNERIKPVKEIVGYVRSPQGLAIKVINDHVVKIPAWVGYALDPVGSIKHRAFDEIRSYAKGTMGTNGACASAETANFDDKPAPGDAI